MYEHARFETKVLNNIINFHLVAKYILKSIGTKAKKKKKKGEGGGRMKTIHFPPPPFTHEKSWEERAQKNICIIIWIAEEKK